MIDAPRVDLAAEVAIRFHDLQRQQQVLVDFLVNPTAYEGLLDVSLLTMEMATDCIAVLDLLTVVREAPPV